MEGEQQEVGTKRAAVFALRRDHGIDITQQDLTACLEAGCPGEDGAFQVFRIAAWIRASRPDLLTEEPAAQEPVPVAAPPVPEIAPVGFGGSDAAASPLPAAAELQPLTPADAEPDTGLEMTAFGPVEPYFCPYHGGKTVRAKCNGTRGAKAYYVCPVCDRTFSEVRRTVAEHMQRQRRAHDEPFAARDFS